MAQKSVYVLCAAISLFILLWLLWLMRFGVDFVDESYYIVSIANPLQYKISLSQFGLVYAPLYRLVGGDLVLLRQVNVLLTFGLAWVFVHLFLQQRLSELPVKRWAWLVLSASLACSALVFLRLWLPTPSYNWLTFQSCLLGAISLLLIEKEFSKRCVAGGILLGLAGWMAFMAKPSSAAALAVFAMLYLLASRKLTLRMLGVAVLTSGVGLCVAAYLLDGSLTGFAGRIQQAMFLAGEMGSQQKVGEIFRFDMFPAGKRGALAIVKGTVILTLAGYFLQSQRARLNALGLAMCVAAAVCGLMLATGYRATGLDMSGYYQLLILPVPLAACVLGLLAHRKKFFRQMSREQWAFAVFLLVLPYGFAFGTSNNYWFMGGLVAIFWVMAGLGLLMATVRHSRDVTLLLAIGFACQLAAMYSITSGIRIPYGQPQIVYKNDMPVTLANSNIHVLMAPEYGHYIVGAMDKLKQAHFEAGTPMLDMSGHLPGVLLGVGARNSSQAWMIGNFPGYEGAGKVTVAMLNQVPCEELAAAWLLREPKGPYAISSDVLKSFGASEQDYKPVVTMQSVKGIGGVQEIYQQQFLKPVRSAPNAVKACMHAREAR